MPQQTLPIPPHFALQRVGEVWRVAYQDVAQAAQDWARRHRIPPALDDGFRVCLVLIDVQNTFCIPGFELYVGARSGNGAVEDNGRLCQFIYRNLHRITHIVPTLDTHQAMQIFHSVFLIDPQGNPPALYTQISAADVAAGRWRFNAALAKDLGFDPQYVQGHLEHYTRQLAASGKYALTVWPYHALLGGIGHALVSAVEEAVFFHTIARHSQPDFQLKGDHPLSEHYSVLGPEVDRDPDGQRLVPWRDALVQKLLEFDAVVVAGQAKSHCVAWTIADLLENVCQRDRRLTRKVYLLEDCTSPVVIPGAIDYTEEADAAFARFAEAGMHVVHTSDPLETWPGIELGGAAV